MFLKYVGNKQHEKNNLPSITLCSVLSQGLKSIFHWIGLKKLAHKYANYNIVRALYSEINLKNHR